MANTGNSSECMHVVHCFQHTGEGEREELILNIKQNHCFKHSFYSASVVLHSRLQNKLFIYVLPISK